MLQGISEQMFSRPENDTSVMSMWELFLRGHGAPSPSLRRPIDDSWRRCQQASVDPNRAQAPLVLADQSLHHLRDHCNELLQASAPVMALARDFLAETGTVMVLTDIHGTVLNLEGDTSTLGAAEKVHLVAGANWSESACGTNAIGTTLAIGKPLQIHSAEHYCEGIKRWSCSATVIHDPLDGSVLGALDVSGLSDSYSRQTLALVVSTAGRIESRLTQSELDIRYNLLAACIDRISGSPRDGIILFDRRGRAIRANDQATLMLAELDHCNALPVSARLSDLTLGGEGPIPQWIHKEYLEPVMVKGQQVGTLLTLPERTQHRERIWSMAKPVPTPNDTSFARVIGQTAVIQQTISRARQLAKSKVPILLSGETGVGKEVFARGIHEANSDKAAPFVALNCGGFSRELLTSELFGHAEGSFTGSKRGGMIGKIEAANGGTLFLDEIGEMPMDLQPHFLRALEEGEVYRLGENKPRKVNFRLIAATHRDLRKEIRDGNFRMDLFYRIAVTTINIPPLRERAADIPLLAGHYLQALSRQHQLGAPRIAPKVLEILGRYEWPGNIREFRNVIENMLLTAQNHWIDVGDIPPEIATPFTNPHTPADSATAPELTRMETAEREALRAALSLCRGNMTAAARTLGIAKSTVYLKLKRFGLEDLVHTLRASLSHAD